MTTNRTPIADTPNAGGRRSAVAETDVAVIVQRAATILLDRKANDVVLLSLKGVSDMTDYFLIASGTSDTHVRSLAQTLAEELKKEFGQLPHHEEGVIQGRWAL